VSHITANPPTESFNVGRNRQHAVLLEAVMTQANLYKFVEEEKKQAQKPVKVNTEERRESGMVFIVIGWLFLLFGVMVALFFHPSSPRFGNVNIRNLALGLALVGILLKLWGNKVRRSAPSKY
jgi:hypothetical protein